MWLFFKNKTKTTIKPVHFELYYEIWISSKLHLLPNGWLVILEVCNGVLLMMMITHPDTDKSFNYVLCNATHTNFVWVFISFHFFFMNLTSSKRCDGVAKSKQRKRLFKNKRRERLERSISTTSGEVFQ